MTDTVIVEGQRSLRILTPCVVEGESSEFTAAAATMTSDGLRDAVAGLRRPDQALILGRFVQGGIPNSNGHEFDVDDLRNHYGSVLYTALNMLHDKGRIVGAFVGAEMLEPPAGDPENLGAPYVDVASVFWKRNRPDDYRDVQRAAAINATFYSMEAIGRSVTCREPGHCGSTFPFRGVYHDTYCEPLRNPGGKLRINQPFFTGGAMVVPPARPGWKFAHVREIAATLARHEDVAERLLDFLASWGPHLEFTEIEAMMLLMLEDTYRDEPVHVTTATRLPTVPVGELLLELTPHMGLEAFSFLTDLGYEITPTTPLLTEPDPEKVPDATAASQTGAIICFKVPEPAASELAGLDFATEPADQIHITLHLLAADVDDDGTIGGVTMDQVAPLIAEVAAQTPPMEAKVSGPGRFTANGPEKQPIVALVSIPGANELRAELTETLVENTVPFSNEHGFTPHATLDYAPAGEQVGVDVPALSFPVTTVDLWWKGQRMSFPLTGTPEAEDDPEEPDDDPADPET